jgi:hypothetical protein
VTSSPASVSVTVADAGNRVPVAVAGSAQTVPVGSSVQLDGSGSSDPDGDALSYQWAQTGGPVVSLSGLDTATPTFVAPGSPATLVFELTVSDGQVTSSPASVSVTVAEAGVGGATYRSSSSTGDDAWGTSVSVPVPAGAAAGDVVVASVSTWGTTPAQVTAPQGFTLKGSYPGASSGGGSDTTRIYWKRLTAADTGSYQFSWSGGQWSSAHAVAVSGAVSSGDPIESIDQADGLSSTVFPSTAVTTTTAPLLAWFGRNDEPALGQHTPPEGFTEVQDRDCTTVAYREPGTAGTHAATGAGYTGTPNPAQAILTAIRS